MPVQRSSLFVTGALQLVGLALAFALASTPVALGAAVLAAIAGPLLLLGLPTGARPPAPTPPRLSVTDVRTRHAPHTATPESLETPPAPLPRSRPARSDHASTR